MTSRERDLQTVQLLLDLLSTASNLYPEPDAIVPQANGYSCWLSARSDYPSTCPLTAEEILDRIDVRRSAVTIL